MKSRMSTQWIRWEAGGEARSTKIIKFYETKQFSNPIVGPLVFKLWNDIAPTYPQSDYGNGVFGNVFLSAGQH